MPGNVMDAEDMVQETFLRWRQVNPMEIELPKAYLTTITWIGPTVLIPAFY